MARIWKLSLLAGIVLASVNAGAAQEKERGPVELTRPEVDDELPPLTLDGAKREVSPADQDVEQLLTSLRRAQHSLELDDRATAMQALLSAEEQLDQAARAHPDAHPWSQIEHAIQAAMSALADDNSRQALVALQRIAPSPAARPASRETDRSASPLRTIPASEILGAEVVNSRGETIAEISDIVRARAGGDDLYAILEVGGFLGIGDKTVALAMDEFEVGPDGQIVLPRTTEDQLERMPPYDPQGYERPR